VLSKEIDPGEILDFIAASVEYGLQHDQQVGNVFPEHHCDSESDSALVQRTIRRRG
jgi:hypothetical protein